MGAKYLNITFFFNPSVGVCYERGARLIIYNRFSFISKLAVLRIIYDVTYGNVSKSEITNSRIFCRCNNKLN